MNDKIAKYVQEMQEQIDFFNKKENRDKFVEYIEGLRKEIERLKVIEKRYNQIKLLLEDKNIDSNLELAIKINQVVHKGM